MLEEKMLREDRVAPNEHVFTAVIGILGRVGYTMKAFQLFNQVGPLIILYFIIYMVTIGAVSGRDKETICGVKAEATHCKSSI